MSETPRADAAPPVPPAPVRPAPPVPENPHHPTDWLARALPATYLTRPFKEVKEDLIFRLEAIFLERLIATHGDNLSRIARAAGVDRQIIRRMLKRHGMELRPLERR